MHALTLVQAATLFLIALTTSCIALALMARRSPAETALQQEPSGPAVAFLFDGDKLVDATPEAHRLLRASPGRENDIARLVALLAPRFPGLYDAVMACNELDAMELFSADGKSRLRLGVGGGRLRLSIDDTANPSGGEAPESQLLGALSEEVSIHRQIAAALPVPVWRQTHEGKISWVNGAYAELAEKVTSQHVGTPCDPARPRPWPDLFDLQAPVALGCEQPQRALVEIADEPSPRVFECTGSAIGDDVLFMALPADRVVKAEARLREFVHTLTQTFAHLSEGLAIFDKDRQLTLFNPALTELLGFSPEYLIKRPHLAQFLDQLRERQVMPEPKDYKSWRQQMSALEAAAADGTYSETWALSDGRTFRVTGRPHPDGAVAFMFEDISAEISLTRRFRSELETSQAVIDSLDEAIAVFSPAGYLTISNAAYSDLWGGDPSTTLEQVSFLDATRRWQECCAPTPVWGDARDFAATFGERSNWTAEVRRKDGRRLVCRFEALPGGATLAAFAEKSEVLFLSAVTEAEGARA